MSLTRSQIEQLGIRLVREPVPADADIAILHQLLLTYERALERAVSRVRDQVDALPTSRVKNTGTILEKLNRHGGSWLKSIQDIAGMRIVGSFDRNGQDVLVAQLVSLFSGEPRKPRVIDRRARPMHGYTAVHVVIYPDGLPVEIQVRTRLQHEWADLFEKLADRIGREIRYGGPPSHWLSPEERRALPPAQLARYDLAYSDRTEVMSIALDLSVLLNSLETTPLPGISVEEVHEVLRRVTRLAETTGDWTHLTVCSPDDDTTTITP
jgi:hypothetical protein